MPNLASIPVPLYQPLSPYNHIVDNLPLDAIVTRIDLVNSQVDLDANTLRDAQGSAGSLINRLNKSLEDDGSIKFVAIDNALHSIAKHLDGDGYVRMTLDERTKLSLIADDATNLRLRFNTLSAIVGFDDGTVDFQNSDTIQWRYTGGSMYADSSFPSAVRHVHYYGIVPPSVNLFTPDYIHYKTTSVPTAYRVGSLRVFLNGVRLSTDAPVDVPIWNGTEYEPISYTFAEGTDVGGVVVSGLFNLSAAITSDITIFIDFDVAY